jgi:two-component system nitrate/nitrite sensor histidine kinase NarX
VIGGAATPISLDPVGATVLSSLGDLLGAGIATARLRQQVERTEVERERMRLAAELHDGLAQDLALAVRELALLESDPGADAAAASLERLRAAVTAAHRVVRAGLEDLSVVVPIGGIHAAVHELCERYAKRGVPVAVEHAGLAPEAGPEVVAIVLRVLNEALANAERHAQASAVAVSLRGAERALELTVADDGLGFDPAHVDGPGEGHFGMTIMQERARGLAGDLEVRSAPGGGTVVSLHIPLR